MSGRSFDDQVAIREQVVAYLETNGMTSLRKIAKHVQEQTEIITTPATIARLVRRLGYKRAKVEWVKESKK